MDVLIDKAFPQILINGQELPLTRREYDMFVYLWENRGKICTRSILYNSVYGGDRKGRATDITIARLRKKLGDMRLNLVTKKGYGYYITA